MKKMDVKKDNSSCYWCDFEGELCVYFHYKWNNDADFLIEDFISNYVILTKKYKIAVPINEKTDSKIDSFYPLYQVGDKQYYPTHLFTNLNNNSPQKLISIDPLITLENSETKFSTHGSIPLRIELIRRDNSNKVLCYLDNDLFNPRIDNKKTKRDPEIGGRNCVLDNSDLAYLNTPRLNSFLRDLKILCMKYGATEFEFENLGLKDFTENGVLFDGEIVYYEDVVDVLEPNQRIVG